MDLHGLLQAAPQLHSDFSGAITSWQLSDEVLQFIDGVIDEESTTLETGEGVSTILFAIKHARHTCVSPNQGAIDNIVRFCVEHGIATDRLSFEVKPSEDALPFLASNPLDLVLIDGGHGFPTPFVDWRYTAARLREGGLLILDDTQLWTVRTLRDFLASETEWRLEEDFARASVFRKVAEYRPREWIQQPYVAELSRSLRVAADKSERRQQTAARLRRALAMVRRGELVTLARRLVRRSASR
jgi:hypothetical protein